MKTKIKDKEGLTWDYGKEQFTEGRIERDRFWLGLIKDRIKELEDLHGITELKRFLNKGFKDYINPYAKDEGGEDAP